jgi:hypothetical protein
MSCGSVRSALYIRSAVGVAPSPSAVCIKQLVLLSKALDRRRVSILTEPAAAWIRVSKNLE